MAGMTRDRELRLAKIVDQKADFSPDVTMSSFDFIWSDGESVANILRDEFLTSNFIADLATESTLVSRRSLQRRIIRRAEELAERAGISPAEVWGHAEDLAIEVFERYELHHVETNEIIAD